MNIADRIQNLRKGKGISQEELADSVGVSRQAVSKWESEQSVPDIEKIILLSEYFQVTTDYLLKGIESRKQDDETKPDARIFGMAATALNFIGLIVAGAVWYEKQVPMALVIGLVFMALGCMVFGIGWLTSRPGTRKRAKRDFWTVNIWILSFIPLSLGYNMLLTGLPAPYPLLGNPAMALPVFWLVYAVICGCVVIIQKKGGTK